MSDPASDRAECVRLLRDCIARADREEIAAAQRVILECVTRQPNHSAGVAALDGVLADLAPGQPETAMSDHQRAFETVVVAMIERTRTMLLEREGAA